MNAMHTTDQTVYQQFAWVGRDLYQAQMVSSHGGNLSIRRGNRLVIKRSGAMLAHLQPEDLIETGISQDDENTPLCSTELIVHRAIYRATPAKAVVHAHPRTAVALSLTRETISPLDSEGGTLLGPVAVVAVERPSGSPEVARAVAEALETGPIVVVRSHGSFAIGDALEKALQLTSILEESCQIIWKTELLEARRRQP
ncbi:MAG: aldolase [Anaerolineae bacterium]|jgi:L-fuculose-phosphate aldolase